ncbi:MAG: hypothetical protein K2L16_01805 [Muribaculaceae bacterium]|nr:hypothetical protein [Muribaculaceae bacterium]
MKKLYFTLVACLLAMTVSAAPASKLYLIGEPAGGWSPLKGTEMTETSAGVFELDVNLTKTNWFGFSQKLGNSGSDWSTMNGARYGAPSNNYSIKLNETVSLSYPSENAFMLGAGDWHFKVDTNTNKFTLTGQEIEDPTANVFYLRGAVPGWNATDANKFTQDGDTYTISLPALSGEFKVANSDYSKQYSASAPIELGVETTVSNLGSSNSTLKESSITNVTVTFVKVSDSEGKITINGTVEGGGVEIDYSQWYVNVLGDFNNWQDNGVNPVDGISKHENLAIGTTGFKVKVWNGADVWHFVEGSIATDEWVDFPENSFGGSATLIEGATEGSVYTVEFDCANNKVKVTKIGGETPEPVIPAAMYMSGDLGAGWEFNKEMTKAENVFTYDFVAGGQAHVTFTSGIMTEWVVADGVRYGAGDEDVAVELGTSYAMTASSDKCWSLPAGNYKATVTFDEEGVPTVVFSGETAEIFEIPEALFLSYDVEDGNWNFNNEMTNEGDGVFTAELVVPGNNAYITFATGNITVNEDLSWAVDGIRYGAGEQEVTIAMGESYTMEENNGNCWIIAGAGTYALTVTYDADAKTITLMAEKTSVPATDPVLYLRGADFGNWEIADETNQFTLEGGVYTLHVAALNGAFKITDADSNDENTITVADAEVRQDMVAGQTYTTANLYGSDADNMIMAEALTDVTVTYDRDNATIKVEGTVAENAVKTYTLMGHFYIYRGEINALAEAAWNEIAMTEENGIYTATVVPTTAEGRMLIAGTRNGVALGYYKAAADAAALTAEAPANLAIDGTHDLNFNLNPEHKYELTYNAESGELAAEDKGQTTGVEGIVAEDAEAPVYYNLQGVRVDNPAAGLYIVVRGSKVAKEMVK